MLSIDGTFLVIFLSFFVFMVFMNGLFFKPIMKIKQERKQTIDTSHQAVKDVADKTAILSQEYQQQISEARRKAQQLIQEKRDWAKDQAGAHLGNARKDALDSLEHQTKQLKENRENVYQELQSHREALVETIIEKLSERQTSAAGASASSASV